MLFFHFPAALMKAQIPTSTQSVTCYAGLGCNSGGPVIATIADCCDNQILPPVGCSYRATGSSCVDCPVGRWDRNIYICTVLAVGWDCPRPVGT